MVTNASGAEVIQGCSIKELSFLSQLVYPGFSLHLSQDSSTLSVDTMEVTVLSASLSVYT